MRGFLLFLTLSITVYGCKKSTKEAYTFQDNEIFTSTKEIPDNHFLGDKKCKECHQQAFKDWQGSHHDKAMQIADSSTILGNFNSLTFTSQGVTSRFFKKHSSFYVNTEGPDGKYHDYKIEYTFGITPLQQYIVKFPNGHYQCLRTAWDSVKNKWFDLYPDFKVVHSEWLHWSRGALNWNTMCSDCHSTNVQKNYDQDTHSYKTMYAIINVSCEACHGPGKQHIEEVKRLGKKYQFTETMQMTLKTTPKELVDQCARCHMRREQFSKSFNFEGTLLDHYFPQLIEEPFYYPDGQILDEDYVYGSFVQSKMYKNNVTCNDCHNSHSLKLRFNGNDLCTQCHTPKKYDTPKHHFHKNKTEGALCVNCHMPGKYYMGNDFRRDHSFRVPRPDLSLKYGTPNACTGCHKNKDDKWANRAFKNLYGNVDSTHFSDKLIPGIIGEPHANIGLLELINDTTQVEIARASAVKALSNYRIKNFVNDYLTWLNDKSPLVRAATIDVLSDTDNNYFIDSFLKLLKDPKRSVRVKAFYALGSINESQIPKDYKINYQNVKNEFLTYLNSNSDFVGGLIKKANYNLKQGHLEKGIQGYESALKIDNTNNQARFTLANLYYNSKQYNKAEIAFITIIKQEPNFGPTYYSLGLLYAELNQTEKAIIKLKQAINKSPNNIRAYYNLALLYDKKQDRVHSEKTLIKGLNIDSNNESLLYALAYHYYKHNEPKKAKNIALKLTKLFPYNKDYLKFYNSL